MGIAVAIIYLPIYFIFSIIAVVIAYKSTSKQENSSPYIKRVVFFVSGIMYAVIGTGLFIWLVSKLETSNEYATLVYVLACTLIAPFLLGLIMLTVSNIVKSRHKPLLRNATSGAFHATLVVPWIALFLSANYKNIVEIYSTYIPTSFSRLCENSGSKIYENVDPARSVAFVPGSFITSNKKGHGRTQMPGALLLVENTPLEYVDSQVREWNGDTRYIRTTSASRSGNPPDKHSLFSTSDIDSIDAEYVVSPSRIEISKDLPKKTYGQKIEVRKTSDNRLIAELEYYWNTTTWQQCPENIHGPGFVRGFVADALNLPKK